jgi:hypothetical protein
VSLSEAILEIADDMDGDASNTASDLVVLRNHMHSYARQLRRAVKAAEGSAPPPAARPEPVYPPEVQTAIEVAKARKEFQKVGRPSVSGEEIAAGKLTEMIGGVNDKTFVEIDPAMQTGQGRIIGGQVYELRADGKLHYHEQETERRLKKEHKIIEGKA